MHRRRLFTLLAAALCCGLSLNAAGPLAPQSTTTTAAGGAASITPDELKGWLSYVASDELEGRQVFTEGLGLAAGYIADHLKEWGVKAAGDDGTYFQEVKVLGIDTTSRSSVTVTVNGRSKTFKDGEGVTFRRTREARRR